MMHFTSGSKESLPGDAAIGCHALALTAGAT